MPAPYDGTEKQEPCALVIFGATGDLTKRKLISALYSLTLQRRLPEGMVIVGTARSEMSHEEFRRKMRDAVGEFARGGPSDPKEWDRFARDLYYLPANHREPESYLRLKDSLSHLESKYATGGRRVLYLAIPPDQYGPVIQQIAAAGLAGRHARAGCWTRVVIEKPFGTDLETARELNRQVHEAFDESQVYRIDHYLGKETVQNILVFRFGNAVFEPIWNRRYVDYVEITAAETVGIESRGEYYERAGVIRDMFQNHLLQLLCLTAMEPPVAFAADPVRDEKAKVLGAIRPISPADLDEVVVRGQYEAGAVAGKKAAGYREEPGVAPGSATETYAALKLSIDSWRWEGVPFYLRSGKRLAKRVTEIAIHFKRPPLLLFKSCSVDKLNSNVLVMRIQPDEGISLTFEVKPPGPEICVNSLCLDFDYEAAFGAALPDAYETLLVDCIRGDSTLFIRQDWVELAWSILTPLLQTGRATRNGDLAGYPAGSSGPKEADEFIEKDGREWRRL
ncbi:MAG TPA: glucose-6-phosphate dehydrogenase [Candidatus Binatia bacterium]